jgi:hypothetical protein
MDTYRLIITTDSIQNGRPTQTTERVRHIPADQLDSRKDAARQSAPAGATRTIKTVQES